MAYRKNPKRSDIWSICCNNLKFEKDGFTIEWRTKKMRTDWETMQTQIRSLLQEQSDLGLHCLPRDVCPKPLDHYDIYMYMGKNDIWRQN